MKKVVRSAVIVALMFATAIGMANEPKLRTESASKNLILEMDAENNQTSVKFIDNEGNVIHSDSNANTDDYIKKFNLQTLPEGLYYLKIENSLRELVYTLSVNETNIDVVENREILKPAFKSQDNKVSLSLLNLKKEDVEIKVLDSSSRIVFEEVLSEEMNIQKAFDFNLAPEDTYTIVVKDSNDIYYNNVVVK